MYCSIADSALAAVLLGPADAEPAVLAELAQHAAVLGAAALGAAVSSITAGVISFAR